MSEVAPKVIDGEHFVAYDRREQLEKTNLCKRSDESIRAFHCQFADQSTALSPLEINFRVKHRYRIDTVFRLLISNQQLILSNFRS